MTSGRVSWWLAWANCLVFVFGGLSALSLDAEDPLPGILRRQSDLNEGKGEPHPWIAEAPPAFVRLIEAGRVKLMEDDREVRQAQRTALTIFSFSLSYRMRYRVVPLSANRSGPARALVHFADVESVPEHRILLASGYRPVKPWESALLQHEFDHVAISTDPRLIAILASWEVKEVTFEGVCREDQSVKEWVEQSVEKSVSDFQQAVERLVRSYYVRLDEESRDGLQAIHDRRKFFATLYSIEDLRERKFEYLKDVEPFVLDIKPEQWEAHYRLP